MAELIEAVISPQPLATRMKPHIYKSLLNQYSQKIWKQLPMYQTLNEGSEHSPKFRCTVWVVGVGYTSPNTFQQRKMAEMDASRVALFGTLQKLKNEASRLVCEDKSLCKSILVEYANRLNIQNPTYNTIQLDTPSPVFRSSLVFDDISCTGENSRSKKEAEKSAAHAVVLKCLDSESGILVSEIIKRKYKSYAVIKKLQNAHNGTYEEVVSTGSENGVTLINAKVEEGTKMPHFESSVQSIPATQLSVDSTQSPSQEVTTQALTPVTTVLPHIPFARTHVVPSSTVVSASPLGDFPSIPVTHLSSNVVKVENSEAFSATTQALTPAISATIVLPQTPFAGTHVVTSSTVVSAPPLGDFSSIPVAHLSSNVVKVENSEALSVTAACPLPLPCPTLAQATFLIPTSGKKRNRRHKKRAQKKMRVEDQWPMHDVPPGQLLTFATQ